MRPNARLDVPDLCDADVVFGYIKHLPPYADIPSRFKNINDQFARSVSDWFYSGAKFLNGKIVVDSSTFAPKPGIDAGKATRAIHAALRSFAPKHEHKIAGCAFMLSEWFEPGEPAT